MEHEKNQSNYWMTKTGQNIESRDIGFKSHRGHCDHSIAASTADCGLVHGGSIPPSHIWVYLHLKIEENIIENGDGERTLLGLQRNAVSIIMR